MKDYIKIILSVFSRTKSFLFAMAGKKNNKVSVPVMFYKSFYSLKGSTNKLNVTGKTEKSNFFINGTGNEINLNNTEVTNSIITLSGNNNSLQCEDGVKLRNTVITIRGTNCKVTIGNGTTFGGVRIISAGQNNEVNIGDGCLFADFIEIWASDTHPVYNEKNEIINTEKSINIGNRVWVGARVIILKGVTIESGSVVGMGSLVINDVPASSVTVGNPNRIVKNNVSWGLYY